MEGKTGKNRSNLLGSGSASVSTQSSRTFTLRNLTKRNKNSEEAHSVSHGKGPLGLTTLWSPSESGIADVVFIHGLNGGSQSTWTYNGDKTTFWPKEWLPEDSAFQDVRLHSFGYSSGWSHASILNINDFAQALLASIQDAPQIPRGDSASPLILIAHSMGGLVAKKAYILSKQIAAFGPLSQRVIAIFFLATPHRGSNMAEMLTKILGLGGARPFVRELHRDSPTLQAINEEFPRFCGDLQLFSFFETQPMNYGIGKGLIVEKECAVLNYRNERTAYLNANHRDVARFVSRSDTAYITVRNALATTLEQLRSQRKSTNHSLLAEQKQILETFLGIDDVPEDMLGNAATAYVEGSCEWFTQRECFRNWRDHAYSETLWTQGKPGVGKSVLAGHVITHLRRSETRKDCCFYFFARSDKPRSTVSSFLRSIAFQMAVMHPEIMEVLTSILSGWKDLKIGKVDSNPIWRRLFNNGILKVKLNATQYWVIDGLDECKEGAELISLLARAQEMWPLCILITSRDTFDTVAVFQPKGEVVLEQIHEKDTKSDISLLIDRRIWSIPAKDEEMRGDIRQRIIDKSAGSFLWVDLVLKRLQKAHLSTDVERILNSVPSDMNELYHEILVAISEDTASRHLAKAILRWVTYASRPITTLELQAALELDLEDTVNDIERSIAVSCGHLVFVDAQSQVRLVHQTAREFLTDASVESEFFINKASGHRVLALTCLKYLSGSQMQPPRSRKLSLGTDPSDRSPFVKYAAVCLFDHVSNAGAEGRELIPDLVRFFESPNVLTWIEYLSQNDALARLLQAGKTIGTLLKNGMYYTITGISRDMSLLEAWSTDLIRLASKFGQQLQSNPQAIHDLIPQFCPTDSAIYKRFASNRGLHIVGAVEKLWNDCSSMISRGRGETITAAICSDKHIVLGTMQKTIYLYDQNTYQHISCMENQEPVMVLAFGITGTVFASSGTRSIKIWSTESKAVINSIQIPSRCMSIAFVNNDGMLLAALRNNEFLYWDISQDTSETARWTVDPDVRETLDYLTPTAASISLDQGLLAVSYRAHEILVWNYSEEILHDHYSRASGSRINLDQAQLRKETVLALAFSEGPESNALVAGYMDGELVLFDTQMGTVRCSVHGVNAQTLCSSPDGRTLATGDAAGTIRIFDLESLRFLYKISFDAEFIAVRSLTMTSDNHRLLDIRGRQCRVWEPIALLRQEADDANSDALSVSTMPMEVEFEGPMNVVYITAMTCSRSGDFITCGKDDGSVHLYRTSTGQHIQKLLNHSSAINFLVFDDKTGLLFCADQSSRVGLYRVSMQPRTHWQVQNLFDTHCTGAIVQVLANSKYTRILVSTADEDLLLELSGPKYDVRRQSWGPPRSSFSWAALPMDAEKLLYLCNNQGTIHSWDTLDQVSKDPIHFDLIDEVTRAVRLVSLPGSQYLAGLGTNSAQSTTSQLWRSSSLQSDSRTAVSVPEFEKVSKRLEHIIGVYCEHLIYLDMDGWVCSAALNPFDANSLQRHFFIPADWQSLNSKAMISITSQGDIVFSKRSELLVVRRGVEFERKAFSHRTTSMSGKLQGVGGSRRAGMVERPKIPRVSKSAT
ncbi:NACHT and WD domain-containing protein [Pestalotiopsis sp. NC0098]|nr:NACHT and WD domain-containing protein [Pestalotiopsis sp. NC0098]